MLVRQRIAMNEFLIVYHEFYAYSFYLVFVDGLL